MPDYNFSGRDNGDATISATSTFQLDPSSRYEAELSGNAGGATPVDLKYQLSDGSTYAAYPDNPGAIGKAIEIVTPRSGVVQVAVTGGSGVAIKVSFGKIKR